MNCRVLEFIKLTQSEESKEERLLSALGIDHWSCGVSRTQRRC